MCEATCSAWSGTTKLRAITHYECQRTYPDRRLSSWPGICECAPWRAPSRSLHYTRGSRNPVVQVSFTVRTVASMPCLTLESCGIKSYLPPTDPAKSITSRSASQCVNMRRRPLAAAPSTHRRCPCLAMLLLVSVLLLLLTQKSRSNPRVETTSPCHVRGWHVSIHVTCARA